MKEHWTFVDPSLRQVFIAINWFTGMYRLKDSNIFTNKKKLKLLNPMKSWLIHDLISIFSEDLKNPKLKRIIEL